MQNEICPKCDAGDPTNIETECSCPVTVEDLLAGRGELARRIGAALMPEKYHDQQSPPPIAPDPDDCRHDICIHGTVGGPVNCCSCGLEL